MILIKDYYGTWKDENKAIVYAFRKEDIKKLVYKTNSEAIVYLTGGTYLDIEYITYSEFVEIVNQLKGDK